jgi:hypothetical protein
MLSLSVFGDAAALAEWRTHAGCRRRQTAGRGGVFPDDRLRVASVIRDDGMSEWTMPRTTTGMPVRGQPRRAPARESALRWRIGCIKQRPVSECSAAW